MRTELSSDDLIIQEHLQWFQIISLQYASQLLTPDDLIVQEHIARKYRCKMTPKQSERRQLRILSPKESKKTWLRNDL